MTRRTLPALLCLLGLSCASSPGPHRPAQPPAEQRPAPAETSSKEPDLRSEQIDEVIRVHKSELARCYEDTLADEPRSGQDQVVARWTISRSGSVSAVSITSHTFATERVPRCVAEVVAALRFPSSGNRSVVNYPFLFAPPEDDQ